MNLDFAGGEQSVRCGDAGARPFGSLEKGAVSRRLTEGFYGPMEMPGPYPSDWTVC